MAIIDDSEFGKIVLRRSKLSKYIRLRVDQNGKILISLPLRSPLYLAKRLLEDSRSRLRILLAKNFNDSIPYREGDIIGKFHYLRIINSDEYKADVKGNELVISRPLKVNPRILKETVESGILKSLRSQSKKHLTKRLKQLTSYGNFEYNKVRFSNAGTRWGSCSSRGTISLNIWMMTLPDDLIDYVIIHELCHTKVMNHSQKFWGLVSEFIPEYRKQKKRLKDFNPNSHKQN